jgi:hypothetical protein
VAIPCKDEPVTDPGVLVPQPEKTIRITIAMETVLSFIRESLDSGFPGNQGRFRSTEANGHGSHTRFGG